MVHIRLAAWDERRARQPDARRRAAWALALLCLAACSRPPSEAGCFSVGAGWRACSGDSSAATAGATEEPAASSGAAPSATAPNNTVASARTVVAGAPRAGVGTGSTPGTARDSDASAAAAQGGRTPVGVPTGAGEPVAGEGGSDAVPPRASPPGAGRGGATSLRDDTTTLSAGGAGSGGSAGSGRDTAGAGAGSGSLPTACCHGLGVCVGSTSLRSQQRALLERDSCTDDSLLCAPVPVLQESYAPKACRSVLNAEGRCLPDCMAGLTGQSERLPRDVCDEHQLCSPCFDPITGNATGTCNLGADAGPRELAQRFSSCCGAGDRDLLGLCVPSSYVPKGSVMPQGACASALYCVPKARLLDPTLQPATCQAEVRGKGVCLPQCLADAYGILITVQTSCASSEVCYPCELVGGGSTGACPAP